MARQIERACVEQIVAEMNELAARYRENKHKIDWLRRVVEKVRSSAPITNSFDRRASGRSE